MNGNCVIEMCLRARLILLGITLTSPVLMGAQSPRLAPEKMPKIGSVSDRYQSFNIEMIEVTGGRFWAPYKHGEAPTPSPAEPKVSPPPGMDPSLYRYRPPIDLANPQLRKLAAALGPSYMRVSGTWANSTYFQDSDEPAPAVPPAGFGGVLTRKEWKSVIDFSQAVDAEIVTSFAISPGVRDESGVWTPIEAKKFLAYTNSVGGKIAAAEMFNEPTFASMGGAPKGYDAAAYGKDFRAFDAFVKQAAPDLKVLGPGSVGEGHGFGEMPGMHMLKSTDMLAASGPGIDIFSYHFYGGASQRCVRPGTAPQITPTTALTEEWLFRSQHEEEYYAKLRDQFAPGKPIWLTETGETACGGDPWAADFIDSFRYLNQLGLLAKLGVQVVIHNTLAASDYALIDESDLTPRPNYWAAVLWRKLMGKTVLDAGPSGSPNLYIYAQCLRGKPGGVALLAINADRSTAKDIFLPVESERYTLSAADLMGNKVDLNGSELKQDSDGGLPSLFGAATKPGAIRLAAASITFLGIPAAGNSNCR